MAGDAASWRYFGADARIVTGPARFIGIIIDAGPTTSAIVKVHEGVDENAPLFASFRVGAGVGVTLDIPGHPILERGIYVDLQGIDVEATVLYDLADLS